MPLSNNIDAQELADRLQKSQDLLLLDVREALEFHTYNIGGINIPLGKLPAAMDELDWDKDDEIIVVCKIGLRSKTAQSILQQIGYFNVRNLNGGITALQRIKK